MLDLKFMTYIFVCDPDLCDARIDVTIREEHDFPNGVVSMTCPCGRAMNWIETTQPTNQIGEPTMTTTEQAVQEAVSIASLSEADLLRVDLENQRNITNELRKTINEHRANVSRLFTKVNDYIEENDCDEDGDISLSELDDILSNVFNNRLVFEKLFEVQVTYTLDATFEIRAKDEDEAREIAEQIGITSDPEFDHDEDPTEWAIDQTRVGYLQRKVN